MQEYIDKEIEYCDKMMKPFGEFQRQLYEEMLSRIKQTDQTVPFLIRSNSENRAFFYYSKTIEGKQYAVHCRKRDSGRTGLEEQEEILLDENEWAEQGGHSFISLGVYEISPDQKYLAFSGMNLHKAFGMVHNKKKLRELFFSFEVDTVGEEKFALFVKNLETGELLSEVISNTFYSVAWSADSQYIFYTTLSPSKKIMFLVHQIVLLANLCYSVET